VVSIDLVPGESWVACRWDGAELFRYVYEPPEVEWESPRPYLHPLRTLGGDLVSLYRPHDHVWHKGITWALPNVGPANFWGGGTYVRDRGYVDLPNTGRMRHDWFGAVDAVDDERGVIDEHLTWITRQGETWIDEHRGLAVAVWPDADAWTLSFETTMRNISGAAIPIGSPTTEGRENAGYGGLFWRGPRSFTGGRVVTPGGEGGDEYMGRRAPWVAFVGTHDGTARTSSLLFADDPANPRSPTKWFVRSEPFACVCPAPFFDEVYRLENEASVSFRYDVVIVDGALDAAACESLVARLRKENPL
jgi:hypothetical protein